MSISGWSEPPGQLHALIQWSGRSSRSGKTLPPGKATWAAKFLGFTCTINSRQRPQGRKDSVIAHGDNRVDLGLLPLDHLGNGVEISISDWTLPDMTSTRLRRTNRIICHRDLLIAAGASHT